MNRSNWINGFGKLILLLALSLSIGVLSAQISGGAGTLANPYQIANARDLNNIRGASYWTNITSNRGYQPGGYESGEREHLVFRDPYVAGDYVKYTLGRSNTTTCASRPPAAKTPPTHLWVQMWESAMGWKPIGDTTEPFHGVYDGNGLK